MLIEPVLVPWGIAARWTATVTTALCPVVRYPWSGSGVSQETLEPARHDTLPVPSLVSVIVPTLFPAGISSDVGE